MFLPSGAQVSTLSFYLFLFFYVIILLFFKDSFFLKFITQDAFCFDKRFFLLLFPAPLVHSRHIMYHHVKSFPHFFLLLWNTALSAILFFLVRKKKSLRVSDRVVTGPDWVAPR